MFDSTLTKMPKPRIVIPARLLAHVVARFVTHGYGAIYDLEGAVSKENESVEFLIRPAPFQSGELPVVVIPEENIPRHELLPENMAALTGRRWWLALFVGVEQAIGEFAAYMRERDGGIFPIKKMKVVGPGMHVIGRDDSEIHFPASANGRWSRIQGALGTDVWNRFTSAHFLIIGVGRSGSLAATTLCRTGVEHITLLDPDSVEPHNLDMESLAEFDVSQKKATAVSNHLHAARKSAVVEPVHSSIFEIQALNAVKRCDIIVCTVDNDAARVAAAFLSTIFLKPMLDIGTGIFSDPVRVAGADIRLIIPGDSCLTCCGGVRDSNAVRETLLGNVGEMEVTPWNQQRAGSLRSLNSIAVHLGIRLMEDFYAERISSSTWLRLNFSADGMPSIERLAVAHGEGCLLCTYQGSGDAAIRMFQEVILDPRFFGDPRQRSNR